MNEKDASPCLLAARLCYEKLNLLAEGKNHMFIIYSIQCFFMIL